MKILTGIGREPLRLAFSPDGRFLVGCDSTAFHLWDLLADQTPRWSVQDDNWFGRNLCFAPAGESLVGGQEATYRRYETLTGEANEEPVLVAHRPDLFSPDGRTAFVVLDQSGWCTVTCLRVTPERRWEKGWEKRFRSGVTVGMPVDGVLLFSVDGSRFARVGEPSSGGWNKTSRGIQVFDVSSGDVVGEWENTTSLEPRWGAISTAGMVLLLSGPSLYAVDSTNSPAQPTKLRNASRQHFTSAAFSYDGSRLATTSNDTAATIWDTSTWEVRRRYEWQIGRLRTVCFAPDGLRCAAASDSGQIVVWDLDE